MAVRIPGRIHRSLYERADRLEPSSRVVTLDALERTLDEYVVFDDGVGDENVSEDVWNVRARGTVA